MSLVSQSLAVSVQVMMQLQRSLPLLVTAYMRFLPWKQHQALQTTQSPRKKKKVNDFLERKQALLGPCIPPKGKQTEQVCALHFLFNCTILFPLRTWIGGWKKQRVLQSCVCWVGALHCWGSALEASQTDQLQINLYPLQAYLAPAPHRLCSTLFSPNCFNLSIYFFQAVQLRMRFPWHSSVTASWWLCATRGHAVLCVCLKPF